MSHLQDEYRARFKNAASKLREHFGKDCPREFFDELESFVQYVHEKDNTERAIEKINERMEREKMMLNVTLVIATFLASLIGTLIL